MKSRESSGAPMTAAAVGAGFGAAAAAAAVGGEGEGEVAEVAGGEEEGFAAAVVFVGGNAFAVNRRIVGLGLCWSRRLWAANFLEAQGKSIVIVNDGLGVPSRSP